METIQIPGVGAFVPEVTITLAEFDAWNPDHLGYQSEALAKALAVNLLRLTHRAPEAIYAFEQALKHDPGWMHGLNETIVTLDAQPGRAAEADAARRQWWERICAGIPVHHTYANDRHPERPLRVGYVSGDFYLQSGTACFGNLILGHSDRIQPVCYSSTVLADGMTEAFKALAEWHDVGEWSDARIAAHVRDTQVDILVDLTSHTPANRLRVFASHPAPVQISGLGYVTGTRMPVMDYLLADPVVTAGLEETFSEQVVHLPCVIGYNWPIYAPDVNALPCLTGPPTFGAFHQPRKLNLEVLRLWAQVLYRVPRSRLIFKGRGYTPDVQAWIRREIPFDVEFREVTTHGEHLAAFHDIDVQLDTFPQTGGVTTCEAALMGVPTLTLTGDAIIHRTSASINTVLGVPECITSTYAEYIDRAAALVTVKRDTLALLRRTLRGTLQASPICQGYTDAVETAFRTVWRRWCAAKESIPHG